MFEWNKYGKGGTFICTPEDILEREALGLEEDQDIYALLKIFGLNETYLRFVKHAKRQIWYPYILLNQFRLTGAVVGFGYYDRPRYKYCELEVETIWPTQVTFMRACDEDMNRLEIEGSVTSYTLLHEYDVWEKGKGEFYNYVFTSTHKFDEFGKLFNLVATDLGR